ncbi:hypothetical protein ACWEVP_42985 [Amycolatopsis sp. NPDC003865]
MGALARRDPAVSGQLRPRPGILVEYSSDGVIQIGLGRSEASALVGLLELLGARPADDATSAEGILNATARRLAAWLREQVARRG